MKSRRAYGQLFVNSLAVGTDLSSFEELQAALLNPKNRYHAAKVH